MNRGYIPGFYFDEEKQKYFKIQKTQHAPEGAKYSYDNYKKEEEAKSKRKREQVDEKRRKRQLLAKAPILWNPLATGIGARSETGLKRSSEVLDIRSQAFVQGLERRVLLDSDDLRLASYPSNASSMSESVRARHTPKTEISCFDYDSATQGIIFGTKHNAWKGPEASLSSILPRKESSTSKPDYKSCVPVHIMAFPSEISSITLTSHRSMTATSLGSRSSPDIYITNLVSPTDAQRTQTLDRPPSVRMKPHKPTTIWCSASFPGSSSANPDTIALGTCKDSGILLLDSHNGSWRIHQAYRCKADVLAISWLSPQIITGGLRSGGVMIWDCRSHAGVQRFSHPSTITGIKSVNNGHGVVVAGLMNEMCLYDMRMLSEGRTKLGTNYGNWVLDDEGGWGGGDTGRNVTGRAPYKQGITCTRPVVRFNYRNDFLLPLGMDVSQELGLVAAGEEDGNVGVWSLRSGERLRTLETRPKPFNTVAVALTPKHVKCLRFVQDKTGPPRLMGTSGPKIIEWAW
ncbi:hypothetical protein FKW77_005580 [Venturia effusa]|uniref:Uncharacterized protein n=1 Tax=Venturia effusa TaxID=50376 RepID=A0A517LMY1_9PEZI|nr:hypothetical protein FKW77_005580 [Venturia effusa]